MIQRIVKGGVSIRANSTTMVQGLRDRLPQPERLPPSLHLLPQTPPHPRTRHGRPNQHYVHNDGHKTASSLIRERHAHHVSLFNLSAEKFARGELGNTFTMLGNSTPCALWVLYHIFSDPVVLGDIRIEVSAMVRVTGGREGEGRKCSSIDLARIKTACPVLLSTFQETMRFRAVAPGPRVLLDEVLLDDGE